MEVAERRHFLRRFMFAATPAAERTLGSLSAEPVLAALIAAARRTPEPRPPDFVDGTWTNSALRTAGTPAAEADRARKAQVESARTDIERLRQWWLAEMIAGAAPLRENLVLFFHGLVGSSTAAVDIPHALHGCNARLRRACLDTVPSLLDALVVDPAMMIQIGMDEHGLDRVSDRPAKLILDHWTVGAGEYADADVENLSRALTGWVLRAAPSQEPAVKLDPRAPRVARRTGLTPTFDPREFDAEPKTILGMTRNFDARSAIAFLARQPATARRISRELIHYLGIEDPKKQLEQRLASTYLATGGSVEALLRAIAAADEFWSSESRWTLIKSPVHLAVGACRQLELRQPPVVELSVWLAAAGQTLFDTPNSGEGGWPGQDGWVTPPDRLAIRYQLPVVLSGRRPPFGLAASRTGDDSKADGLEIPLAASLRTASRSTLVSRLDPGPGVDLGGIDRAASRVGPERRSTEIVRRIMTTPQYQVA